LVELPTGTVTFLFTDLEGSTRLWEEHPEAMRAALARHDDILRRTVEKRDGVVVKTTGDGLHAAFATAPDAVSAAIDAQRELAREDWTLPEPLKVRMGLHTGIAEARDGDYYGTSVNRAARVAAAAHGGQIVASAATADLVRDELSPDLGLVDLGEHRLRDLGRPERIAQVTHPDLATSFPALRSLDAYPGNLPVQRTAFVGRADDLAEVGAALDDAPVVTLTGVGGVGKTRLALQVAADAVGRFPDGAWFVDLGPVVDAEFVGATIKTSLSLPERRQGTIEESVVSGLRDKHLVLVLDNCEHLIEAVARLVDRIVGSCGAVRVLATSREALEVEGEETYEVRPFAPPPRELGVTDDALLENDAVRLFADRGRSAKRGFALTAESASVVADICRRLDGIPLAIELAAARLRLMSPAEILERLDERFELLTAGRRTVLERHQTLRGAIDWSYALLEPAEQLLFARLSVFAGGFTVDAAEQVAVDDAVVHPSGVLTLLGSLVAKSMVATDDTDAGTRYRLLETLREYAWERLCELDDPARVQALHAAHVLRLVESAVASLKGADGHLGAARLLAEQDNLRVALTWSRDHDTNTFVRLVLPAGTFWQFATNFRELSQWTRAALQHAAGLAPGARAELLALAGLGANYSDHFEDAIGWYEQSIRCSEEAGLTPVPVALAHLGIASLEANRPDDAARQCEAGVEAARAVGDEFWELFAMGNLALAYGLGTHPERALVVSDEMMQRARRLGNQWLMGTALMAAGVTRALDQPDAAIELLTESAELLPTGNNIGQAYFFRGVALLRLGRDAEGATMLRDALPFMKATGSDFFTATVVGTGATLLARDVPATAARLLGAIERFQQESGMAGAPGDIETQRRARARLERAMNPDQLAEAWRAGAELSIEEAADLAHVELGAYAMRHLAGPEQAMGLG
jgi:predicted ATPase/class 3 adenylate cyclase